MTPEEEYEYELAKAKALKTKKAPAPVSAEDQAGVDALNERQREGGSPEERRWGQIVSFLSGSPAFGTVSRAADSLTGRNSQRSAQMATDQYSPKIPRSVPLVGGAPVLPIAGSMAATLPAGAARIGGTVGGMALNTARASAGARVGLQAGIGGVTAADRGGGAGDIAAGTGMGALAGLMGEGAGAGLSRLGTAVRQPLSDFAESTAVKALLGGGQIVNRVKNAMGIRSEPQLQALGREVLDEGLLANAVGMPRNTIGINEANKRMLETAGGTIGEGVQMGDRIASTLPPGSLGTPQPAQAADVFRRGVDAAAQRTGTAMQSAPEVAAMGSALEMPGLNSFRQMWDTKAALGNQAFAPGAARVSEKAGLMRAGQQAAARDIEGQLANAIGPDEMDAVRAAMGKYRLGKRVEGVVEDAATRDMAKSGPGLKDLQVSQTAGATGWLGLPVAMASKFVRGRLDSGMAVGADALSRYAPAIGGVSGAGARMGAPAAVRQSIADPLGPLRQYLGLSPEERKKSDVEAFEAAP